MFSVPRRVFEHGDERCLQGYSNEGEENVKNDHMPTPDELNHAPELAVLAVLDTAIEAATRALVAAYPGLSEDWRVRSRTQPEVSAYRLLSRMGKVEAALGRYRQAVLREPPLESDAVDDLDVLSGENPGAF